MIRLNPSMKITEVAYQLGQLWKNMAPEEKLEYINQSEQDRKRYERELQECGSLGEYENSLLRANRGTKLRRKGDSIPKPKRVRTPYSFFLKSVNPPLIK